MQQCLCAIINQIFTSLYRVLPGAGHVKEKTIGINKKELVSFYSHFSGAVLSGFGLISLMVITWGDWVNFIVCIVYGLAMINLFTSSSLYHAFKRSESSKSIWRKLDHVAIYIMIAGTYTPLVYSYLEGAWLYAILGVQWGLVVAGLFFKFLFIRAPRVLSVGIYLLMGWMAVVFFSQMWSSISVAEFWLLVSGGISYSAGAVIYALKKPDPVPGLFGFHEIFHLFILGGALLHYITIIMAVS